MNAFFDDFVGAKVDGSILHGAIPWVIAGTGSPVVSVLASAAGAPGRISLTTSGSSGDSCLIRTQAPIAMGDIEMFAAGATYSSSSTNGYLAVGVSATVDYGLGEGFHWIHDSGLDSNWHGRTQNGAGSTQSQTTFAAGIIPLSCRALRGASDAWFLHQWDLSAPPPTLEKAFHHVAQLPDPATLVYPFVFLRANTAASKTAIVDCIGIKLRNLGRVPGFGPGIGF